MTTTALNPRCIARLIVLLLAALACSAQARADGGRLRFRKPAGPFIVTLFTSPDPLTAGRADFSLAVEDARRGGLVQDANIELVLTPSGRSGHPLVLHPSHAAATSKWLQAANFSLPSRGLWGVDVIVRHGGQRGQCSGQVQVGAGGARNLWWDVLPVPLMLLLFLLHQWRKARYDRARRDRATPAERLHAAPRV